MDIQRGARAVTADGRRVGDVIEVHPTYILVSRGIFPIKDTYVPIYAVEQGADGNVRLTLTRDALRKMDWRRPPRTPLAVVRPDDDESPAEPMTGALLASTHDAALASSDPSTMGDSTDSQAFLSAFPDTATPALYDGYQQVALPDLDDQAIEGYETLGIAHNGRIELHYNLTLAYRDLGAGRPVVLIHDWLHSSIEWDALIERLLGAGYRVIVYDMRGAGLSDAPADGYDIDTLTRDVRTLIRTLDLTDVALIGGGLGGAIALNYAATYREGGVNRLVILGAAGPTFVRAEDTLSGLERAVVDSWIARLRGDRPAFTKVLLRQMWHNAPDDATVQWYWQSAMQAPLYATIGTLSTLRDLDLRARLGRIMQPVTIVHGTEDTLVPLAQAESLLTMLPDCDMQTVEGVGHLALLEQPLLVTNHILACLERDPAPTIAAVLDSVAGEQQATEPFSSL